ncbi:MAG: MoaD/ThiS family protein [Candidatus Binatia bacterium]
MVEVTVTFVGLIKRLVGTGEEVVSLSPKATLGKLLEVLVARFGRGLEEHLLEDGDLAAHATVLINGRNALSQGGLRAELNSDPHSRLEIVVLGPPLMGG